MTLDSDPYTPPAGGYETGTGKRRHVIVTVWLVLMTMASCYGAITHFLVGLGILEAQAPKSSLVNVTLAGCHVLYILFVLMLFKWKAWGFAGYLVTACVAGSIAYWCGVGLDGFFRHMIPLAVLYGVLQIGRPASAWAQLE